MPTDKQIASRMSRIGTQVMRASQPRSILWTIGSELIVIFGVLAALCFLYVAI